MATQAQILANQANAAQSTGPKTEAGKAAASRNATRHGFASGFLSVPDDEIIAFCQFEANMLDELAPNGAVESETADQLIHAAWRLRRLQGLIHALSVRCQSDPLIHPDAEAELRQLTRYRAAMEMSFFRAMKMLRELQTQRAAREIQLLPSELALNPPHVHPGAYAKTPYTRGDRAFMHSALKKPDQTQSKAPQHSTGPAQIPVSGTRPSPGPYNTAPKAPPPPTAATIPAPAAP